MADETPDPEDADVADAPAVFTGAAPGLAMTPDSGHFHAVYVTFWLQWDTPTQVQPGDLWIKSKATTDPAQPLAEKSVYVYDGVHWIRLA